MHLSLVGGKGTGQLAENFSDDDFRHLVSGLADLETLTLQVINHDVTSASLVTLAKCCPKLQSCRLGMYFNILDLPKEQAPLFPNLHELHVASFFDPEISALDPEVPNLEELIEKRAQEHVVRLIAHLPRTIIGSYNFPHFPHDVKLSEAIMRIWGEQDMEDDDCHMSDM